MAFLQDPVIYLDVTDITDDGKIMGVDDDIAVVFVHASFCGHCTTAKPAVQEFANKNPGIKVFAVHTDGKAPGDQGIGDKINKHIKVPGYPHYSLVKKGKLVDAPISGRTVSDLEKFVKG
jgi:thiol-disulfide isomerase/thioredoxin